MKKVLSLLLALTMIFALAACAAKTEPSGSEAEPAETPAEDGQNPVMNFVGNYACDRASILVEADGADGAKISVQWGSSAWEPAAGASDVSTICLPAWCSALKIKKNSFCVSYLPVQFWMSSIKRMSTSLR